jgi:hypothetical protein
LRALVNPPEKDYRLAIGRVAAAGLTDIPYPILFVECEQGTARSDLVRSLLWPIGPQPVSAGGIVARASRTFSFANGAEIPAWLSNGVHKGVIVDAVLQHALAGDPMDRFLSTEPEYSTRMPEIDVRARRTASVSARRGGTR